MSRKYVRADHLVVGETYTIESGMGGIFSVRYITAGLSRDGLRYEFWITDPGWEDLGPVRILDSEIHKKVWR